MFILMLGHIVPNWRPTWVVKPGAKKFQMLGTENTTYKGKSLHVHRNNNKNHILEN
jgi:hypothetical protein